MLRVSGQGGIYRVYPIKMAVMSKIRGTLKWSQNWTQLLKFNDSQGKLQHRLQETDLYPGLRLRSAYAQ